MPTARCIGIGPRLENKIEASTTCAEARQACPLGCHIPRRWSQATGAGLCDPADSSAMGEMEMRVSFSGQMTRRIRRSERVEIQRPGAAPPSRYLTSRPRKPPAGLCCVCTSEHISPENDWAVCRGFWWFFFYVQRGSGMMCDAIAAELISFTLASVRACGVSGRTDTTGTTRPKRMGRIPRGWSPCTRQMWFLRLLARLALKRAEAP
jgi:hypothetical protein